MTPFVSVLIPTRSRPTGLTVAVNSLLENASNPHAVEFLVRVDDDQRALYASAVRQIRSPGKIIVGPRGNGYDDLHLMYNELAAASKGRWLLQFNDDMRMMTQDWDVLLNAIPVHPDVAMVNPCDEFDRPTTIHPFILKAGIDAIGHFSLNPFCDAWVGDVYGQVPGATHEALRISIRHTRNQMNDDVVEGQRQSKGWSWFNTDEAKAQRAADAAVLRRMMESA